MHHDPNRSMWPAPADRPRPNFNIFAQNKNAPGTFPQNGPSNVSPLNPQNKPSNNSLPSFLSKSPKPSVNLFTQNIESS